LGKAKERERHYETRMPRWLHQPLRAGKNLSEVDDILRHLGLNTVCRSAKCPNRTECFSSRTATFLLMGEICTRNCAFCGVSKGTPQALDPDEPGKVARAAAAMGLEYVVITSVTRDDIADGGAGHFAASIEAVRKKLPAAGIEVLTPDFKGNRQSLATVLMAEPGVFNHNMETVQELYAQVRPMADYPRSLALLAAARKMAPRVKIKSGMMLGLGETREQLRKAFGDLAEAGCGMLTLGQYLRPSRDQLKVDRFVSPAEFEEMAGEAREAGIPIVASAPLVRSSYRAGELLDRAPKDQEIMVDHCIDQKENQGGTNACHR
jgi:lipoyl synthase